MSRSNILTINPELKKLTQKELDKMRNVKQKKIDAKELIKK